MKKQFAIKAVKASKAITLFAAKNESTDAMRFLASAECCQFVAFQGLAPKVSLSL